MRSEIPETGQSKAQFMLDAFWQLCRTATQRKPQLSSFPIDLDDIEAERLMGGPSPLRIYTYLSCLYFSREYFPSPVRILDIGCGEAGIHGLLLNSGITGTYLGIDNVPRSSWDGIQAASQGTDLTASFKALDVSGMDELGLFDCVVTSSALEHFPDINATLALVAKATKPGGISLHIVPAPWSYFLFGTHGFRRFSATDLANFFISHGFSIERISGLGGLPSFLLHALAITAPAKILRHRLSFRERNSYTNALKQALRADSRIPWPHTGYVVVARKGC